MKYLSGSVDDKSLRAFFSQCGEVVSAKVMQHPDGVSKGFGFVSFSSPEAARNAAATLHGCDLTRDLEYFLLLFLFFHSAFSLIHGYILSLLFRGLFPWQVSLCGDGSAERRSPEETAGSLCEYVLCRRCCAISDILLLWAA